MRTIPNSWPDRAAGTAGATGGTRPAPRTGPPGPAVETRSTSRPRLTGRGSVLLMIAVFLVANLIGVWLQAGWASGLGYSAGCLLAVAYARRESLLVVLTTPPLIFLMTLVGAELVAAHGGPPHGGALATAEGTILMLAAVAPWLFGSAVACLAVALPRGLRSCVRELRAELTGRADLVDAAKPLTPR